MIQINNIESAIEALLFTSSEAITSKKIAEILETDVEEVESACAGLAQRYNAAEAGIVLKQIAGGWRLFSAPEYHDLIEKYVLSLDTRKLSAAALETLAIIAYAQPVTRNGVASARGVNSDSSINNLIEKGLVREAGTDSKQNGAVLYATTTAFLEHFGLNSIKDLPPLEDFAPDAKTAEFISERLSATRIDDSEQMFLFSDDENSAEGSKGSDISSEDSNRIEDIEGSGQDGSGQADNNTESCATSDTDKGKVDDADAKSMFETALSSALGVTDKVDLDEIQINTDDE